MRVMKNIGDFYSNNFFGIDDKILKEFEEMIFTLKDKLDQIYYDDGNTFLIWAIANSNAAAIHYFLKALENIQKKDKIKFSIDTCCKRYYKSSALFLACTKGSNHIDNGIQNLDLNMSSVIKNLLKNGACPLTKNGGISPFEISIMQRDIELIYLLAENSKLNSENIIEASTIFKKITYKQVYSYLEKISSGIFTFIDEKSWDKNHSLVKEILMKLEKKLYVPNETLLKNSFFIPLSKKDHDESEESKEDFPIHSS